MVIYIFTILLILMTYPKLKKYKNMYCTFLGAWFSVLIVFRDYSVGIDTNVYMYRFVRFAETEWRNLFALADLYSFEYGFVILNKLLGYVILSSRWFVAIVSLFSIVVLCKRISEESSIPWLSFYIFVTCGLHANSLNLLRQFLAIILVFYSYRFVERKEVFKFIGIIVLAATMHVSALCVLPVYWIVQVKFSKGIILAVLGVTSVIIVAGNVIIYKLIVYTPYAHLIDANVRGEGAVGLTVICIIFFIFIILILGKRDNFKNKNMYIVIGLLAMIICGMTFVVSGIERILPYFFIMLLIIIPNTLHAISNKNIKKQYIMCICILLFVYYIVVVCRADSGQVIPYRFWSETYI